MKFRGLTRRLDRDRRMVRGGSRAAKPLELMWFAVVAAIGEFLRLRLIQRKDMGLTVYRIGLARGWQGQNPTRRYRYRVDHG